MSTSVLMRHRFGRSAEHASASFSDRLSFPAIALGLYVFVVVSRAPDFYPSLYLAKASMLVVLAAALAVPLLPLRRPFTAPETRAVLMLFLLHAIGTPFSTWPRLTVEHLLDYGKVVLLYLLILHVCRSLRSIVPIAWALLSSTLILNVLYLLETPIRGQAVTGTYDANDLALVTMCALPFAVMGAIRLRGLQRVLAAATALAGTLGVVQSQSRGGFVTFVVVFALLIIRVPPGYRWLRPALVAGAVVVFMLAPAAGFWERINTIWGSESSSDYDASGLQGARLEIWKRGLSLMLSNPVFGVGGGTFAIAEGKLELGQWTAPHNSFIQVGAELGIPGLVTFIFLLWRAVRNTRLAFRRPVTHQRDTLGCWLLEGTELGLYAYIVGASALSHAYSPFLYTLLGASTALTHQVYRSERDGRHHADVPAPPAPRSTSGFRTSAKNPSCDV